MHDHLWRKANLRLIPSAVILIAGAIVSNVYGNLQIGSFDHKLVALAGVVAFVLFSIIFLHVLTKVIHKLLSTHRLGAGRAASIQFILRTFGYVAILLMTLQLVGIPVGKLLLGSAVLGIILGVAAQQALANFFASIVLIISHPFYVGQDIRINSGPLGGEYIGTVIELGLTHTRIREKNGNIIFLPNATILSSATIMVEKHTAPQQKKDD
jgi:small-conductance mechanosensitive channel